ncbi:Vegetative incompatibility protein HET-E-1 [Psilocybe cubensis]|uniref:Nephrocystin 3-like N-terminal domain-containing protein n=2 Tax=Psilocybe cubensis TaxID=181762 RepID=A0A8H7Y3E9_PSICU|nr:Vegetative incompatibility protein HET-E-1 [Psilocybe cubensis]KAH9484675.1 Vegetative incompatibility protein HET-E-1 [Psilocybe cubensis]
MATFTPITWVINTVLGQFEQDPDNCEENRHIVEWLTPIRSDATHYDTISKRTPGTGEWVLCSTQFKEWISGQRRILLLDGKPGSGKTIIAAIVIEHLMDLSLPYLLGTDAVLFLYCRHNETWTISQYLGSLIAQLFTNYRGNSSVAQHVLNSYEIHQIRRSQPSETELITILSNMILSFTNVRVVLDALDELPDCAQIELMSVLRRLPVSLFFTSRIIGLEIFDLPNDTIHMTIGDQNQGDIRLFLHKTIPRTASVARIVRQNAEFLEEICDKILAISNGMFLVASLKSQSLQGYTTMNSLSNSLDELSDDVQSMYLALMNRINSQKGEYPALAKRAITWIVYARRPLTVSELQHALGIREGSNSFSKRDIPVQDMLTTSSCGIIEIQSRSGTVRLVRELLHLLWVIDAGSLN